MASKKLLANGLLISKFNYLIAMWGGATSNHLLTAQRTMNQVARWVTNKGKKTKISTLLETTEWLSIRETTRYQSLIQFWKILHLRKPKFMTNLIQLDNRNNATTSLPRLQFTTHGWRWRTTDDWNLLDQEIRDTASLPTFKRKLKHGTNHSETLNLTDRGL